MGSLTLSGGPKSVTFRVDPNSFNFVYSLITNVEDTYGGRVVQILGVKIDSLAVQFESGNGGLDYLRYIVGQIKDIMLWQRDSGDPVILSYPPRNYRLAVYPQNISFRNSLENVTYPYAINFAVQDDINKSAQTGIVSAEMARIQEGIGWKRSNLNDPQAKDQTQYQGEFWKTTTGTTGGPGTSGPLTPGSTHAGDDYPYRGREGVDPWSFYYGECVSFAAWRVRSRTRHKDFVNNWKGAHFGNAKQWDEAARKTGIPVDQTPTVGSIAQHNRGKWGHVAHVVAVNSDGSITVDEYNHAARHIYGQRKVQPSAFDNYLHFER